MAIEGLNLIEPTQADLKMFEFYKKNPDLAAMDILNQDLAPFQRIIIKGVMTHSYVLSILSRGSGKTRMMAMCAALLCMFNPKMRVGFLGPNFRTAKLAFNEFEALIGEAPYLENSIKRISKQTDSWSIEFHNGAFIFALPLAADSAGSIRGFRLHVALIDEFPHVPQEVIERVITPMLATQRNPMANVRRIQKEKELIAKGLMTQEDTYKKEKNKVCGFSSAYFQFNHMYKTLCNYQQIAAEQNEKFGKSDYATYVFNYKDAPEGFFDSSMIEHAKATSSELAFTMEYMSVFPSDSDGFFKRSLIDSCRPAVPYSLEMRGDGKSKYFIGMDPARTNDNFAISIVKVSQETSEIRYVRTASFHKTAFHEISAFTRNLLYDYDVAGIYIDAGGGGLAMKDLLGDPTNAKGPNEVLLDKNDDDTIGRAGSRIVTMIDFSPRWISDANYEMRSSMEHKKLLFPELDSGSTFIKPEADLDDDEDTILAEHFKMIDELQSVTVTATKTGVLHFDVPKGKRKDRYSSLLLAHKAAYDFISSAYQLKELADGGVLGPNGLHTPEHESEYEWDSNIIEKIAKAKQGKSDNFHGASLL